MPYHGTGIYIEVFTLYTRVSSYVAWICRFRGSTSYDPHTDFVGQQPSAVVADRDASALVITN